MQTQVNTLTIELVQSDITDLATDAIVNAANSALSLGAGVAGAIARKGGPSIQLECNKIGYCEVGDAVITDAGNLAAKYVIHAVGPHIGESNARGKLANATRASLTLAERHNLESVALPAISTGVFGYPLEGCAQVMIRVVIDHSFEDLLHLKRVVLCLYDNYSYGIFEAELIKQIEEFRP